MKALIIRCFILIFLLLSTQSQSQTLKIVYNPSTPPLKFTDVDNQPNGMLIDIWKFWAQRNNIKIEFIEASWKETLQMVKDGRADIHAGIYYTKDRDKFFDYSIQPLYENKSYFFYNKNVVNLNSKESLKPFVIGVGNGYPSLFMEEKYQDFSIKKYTSANDLKDAFINNKLNVILSSMPGMTYFMQKNNYNTKQYRYSDKTYAYTKKYYGAVKSGNKKVLKFNK